MKKINKSTLMKIGGIAFAAVAGLGAFLGEIDKQQTEKDIKELKDKVTQLENK